MHIQHHPLPHVFDSAFQSLVSCDVTPCGPPCTDGALTSCSFLTFFFTFSSVFQRRHYSRSWNMISFCFFVSPLFPHLLPSVATYLCHPFPLSPSFHRHAFVHFIHPSALQFKICIIFNVSSSDEKALTRLTPSSLHR